MTDKANEDDAPSPPYEVPRPQVSPFSLSLESGRQIEWNFIAWEPQTGLYPRRSLHLVGVGRTSLRQSCFVIYSSAELEGFSRVSRIM